MSRIAFIINPTSGGGRAGQMWATMKEELDKRFEGRWEEFKTQGPGDAINLARSAALDPSFHLIVSVGGDGTHNEVLNGLLSSHEILSSSDPQSTTFSTSFPPTASFSTTSSSSSSPISSGPGSRTGSPGLSDQEQTEEGEERVLGLRETGKMPALGFIPVGTGGDLRRTLFEEEMADYSALDYLSLLEGPSSSLLALDVGLVEYTPFALSPPKSSSPSSPSSSSSGVPLLSLGSFSPSPAHRRYFLNISSCGISGAICDAANKSSKAFGGFFTFFVQTCYQSLVWKNKQVKWRLGPESGEGGDSSEGPDSSRHPWSSGNLFQLVIANGKYFGGGMKVAPDAKVNDGLFDVIAFCDVGVMDASILVKTYTGSHTTNPNTHKVKVQHSNYVEADLVSPSPSPSPSPSSPSKVKSSSGVKVKGKEGREVPEVLIEADGEVVGRLPARWTLFPSAVRVVVPPSFARRSSPSPSPSSDSGSGSGSGSGSDVESASSPKVQRI